ncbi:MAG: class I SAM-dependent methyltransferase [Promethearchaeota archaeon]
MKNKKKFYEEHRNFSYRTLYEYYISPGIKCKFDLLKENIGSKIQFQNGIDLGCSGNSFLNFLNNIYQKSFFDIANYPLKQYIAKKLWHPICGDLTKLPYRTESFDFVCALDVLEHIKNDELAVLEISRILKVKGIAVITVPHRMKYYTKQDKLIGHYRRYELNQIKNLFEKYSLKIIRIFGVYGQLMRIADFQSKNPEKIETNLLKLRKRYNTDEIFRKLWNFVIKISSKVMKIDAKYQPLKKIMNIAIICKKI